MELVRVARTSTACPTASLAGTALTKSATGDPESSRKLVSEGSAVTWSAKETPRLKLLPDSKVILLVIISRIIYHLALANFYIN